MPRRDAMALRLLGIVGATLIHGAALIALNSATFTDGPATDTRELIVRILPTRVSEFNDGSENTRPSIVLFDPGTPQLSIPVVPANLPTTYRVSVGTAVPILDPDVQLEAGPYARSAGLQPGELANVVLRVEILRDGRPGQVDVDVSSSSRAVDAAAVAYARNLRWLAATVDGEPADLWIRMAVTLRG